MVNMDMCVVHIVSNLGFIGTIKVVQEAGQAEVRHLAAQALTHQDVPGGQVPVDIIVVTEVVHASCYALQHGHQLPRGQLVLPILQQDERVSQGTSRASFPKAQGSLPSCPSTFFTFRKASRAPFSINSVMIMMGFPETESMPSPLSQASCPWEHTLHGWWCHPLLYHPPAHTLCDDALQMQNMWVVELAHDSRLSKEVPPLAIRGCVFQGLNGHSLAVLAGEPQSSSIHFPKLSWVETKQGCGLRHCQAAPGSGSDPLLSSDPLLLWEHRNVECTSWVRAWSVSSREGTI